MQFVYLGNIIRKNVVMRALVRKLCLVCKKTTHDFPVVVLYYRCVYVSATWTPQHYVQ